MIVETIHSFCEKMKAGHQFIRRGVWTDISYEINRKYARVYATMSNGQRTVVNFIDLGTGTVHKADSWKKAGRKIGHIDTFFK